MSPILQVRHPVFSRIDILTAELEKKESEITVVKLIKKLVQDVVQFQGNVEENWNAVISGSLHLDSLKQWYQRPNFFLNTNCKI